jgi:ABC-type transporter Mla MlaB component
MHDIILQFSERVSLLNAMSELGRHQEFLKTHLTRSAGSSQRVIADLGALKEVDTSALSLLLHLDRQVREKLGQPLVIRAAPPNLLSLARLSSLSDVLHWEP